MKQKKQHIDYSIPKDYFKDFDDRLFLKINEDNLPKESGFKTPVGYFEQLDSVILKSVKSSVKQPKVITLFSRRTLIYAASIAACAILVFSLTNTNNNAINVSSLDISSIESYIEEGNLNIDSYDIASILKDEDINSISSESKFISEDLIENYLLENIEDSSILIE